MTKMADPIHPDIAETLREAATNLENDPAYRQRFQTMMAEKRREWLVREADRKLVG